MLKFIADAIAQDFDGDIDSVFLNYWYESAGTPTVLVNYFSDKALNELLLNSGEIVISKDEYSNFIETNKINSIVLLAQAGYFSIKKSIPDAFVIGFPNKDVA